MKNKIPLMLISLEKSAKSSKRLESIVKFLDTKKFKHSLNQARIKVPSINYLTAIFHNGIIYFFLFTALFTALYFSQTKTFDVSVISRGLSNGLLVSITLLLVLYYYPLIRAKQIGEIIDSELLFALNDILIQVRSKVELYKALVNIVEGKYGYVSEEFLDVVNDVESGKSMTDGLKNLALRTKSEFMKRAAWQLINSIKSGSNPDRVLMALINELQVYYHSLINNYGKELNVMALIYLTLAVVAPTIGITILIILSSFGGLAINNELIILIIGFVIIVQPMLIGFINSRRPLLKL